MSSSRPRKLKPWRPWEVFGASWSNFFPQPFLRNISNIHPSGSPIGILWLKIGNKNHRIGNSMTCFLLRGRVGVPSLYHQTGPKKATSAPKICTNIGCPVWIRTFFLFFSTQNSPIISARRQGIGIDPSEKQPQHIPGLYQWHPIIHTPNDSGTSNHKVLVWGCLGYEAGKLLQRKLLPHNQHLTFNAIKTTHVFF